MSCDNDVAVARYSNITNDFLQLRKGTTWVYVINEATTDLIEPDQYKQYYQKEVVRSVEHASQNTTYKIDVYTSDDTTIGYNKVDVYTLQVFGDRVVHMGSDYNIIMLSNQLQEGSKWFNANNTCLHAQSYVNAELDFYTHNNTEYADVIDVKHYEYFHHDVSQLHRSYYGQDVGLIYEMRFDRLRNNKTTITKSLLSYAY